MKKQELIAKIERAIEKYKKNAQSFAESDHPQIIRLRIRAEAKQEAFEAVLLAMRGEGVYLNIEAS
jgi:hypothetical protein